MTSEEAAVLRGLLVEQRVLSLGVIVDGEPWVGLVPFAASGGFTGAIVHTSRLARHTAGLQDGARFGLLIHQPDAADADALQVPRVSVQGRVRTLQEGESDWQEARDRYVAKFPSSEMTFDLADFSLHELVFEKGRLVIGFAQAINVPLEAFAAL